MAGDLEWGKQVTKDEAGEVYSPMIWEGGYRSCCATTWAEMKSYVEQHLGTDSTRLIWPEYPHRQFCIAELHDCNARLRELFDQLPPEVLKKNTLLREIVDHLQAGRLVWYVMS